MKNIRKKFLSTVLAVSLSLGSTILNMPVSASAGNEITVTVSMEGLTLGQGMYFEPETYTLSEINNLVSKEGYGPFDESNLNAGMATLAFFIDNKIEYEMTGSWGNGKLAENGSAYISQIKGIDKGKLNVPQIIIDNGFEYDEYYAQSDDYLGEKDYGEMSGWMVTVNDRITPVGISGFTFDDYKKDFNVYDNNYVVRWQFTLNGYGADLGFNVGWGAEPYFTHANKDLLYKKYAELSADGTFNSNPELKTQALSVMEKLQATQEEVDNALAALESAGNLNINEVLDDTLSKMAQAVPEPEFNSEWTALSLARAGHFDKDSDYFKGYYSRIVDTVNEKAASVNKNGALHSRNYTENSRLIIALSAIGKDAHSVGDWDIISPLEDYNTAVKQGVNGAVYALIALDTHNYQTKDSEVRQKYIDFILSKEISGGGWAFFGSNPDIDMTAMTLQALSRYTDNADVAAAVERGINILSSLQKENGGYVSWGTANAESIAQVITACTALGIDPNTDERFVKNGHSAVEALLEFYDKNSTDFTFRHTMDTKGNAMATNQASYSLVAYKRFVEGKNSLYDMTDVELESSPVKFDSASVSLGGNIGVNFRMQLDNSVISDSNAYMQFELPDGSTVREELKDAEVSVVDGKNYYVFSCEIPAKEMSDEIKAQMIVDNNPVGVECTYSVKEYVDSLVKGDYSEEDKNLARAMLNYGNYAKAYFNGGNLTTTAELNAVTAETLADFGINSTGSLPAGIEYYGSSLLLESDTTLRHYFKVADGIDAGKYNLSQNKGDYYYIDITGIPSNMLNKSYNTTVDSYTISYSPMSYAYAVMSDKNSDESLRNVVRALYLYNQAAVAYQK